MGSLFLFVKTRTASLKFESWLRKRNHPRKKKEARTIDSADEAVELVPVVLETAKPAKRFPLKHNKSP